MDTLRDFHGTPPWMNFSQCYHLTIKSTTNSFQNERPLLARYVPRLDSDTKSPDAGEFFLLNTRMNVIHPMFQAEILSDARSE
jgi:hypothetical protein